VRPGGPPKAEPGALTPGQRRRRRRLDGYLKRCIKRQTANYVAVVLERAGVLELDRERPARVRLTDR